MPCLVAFKSDGTCRLVAYNSNWTGKAACTVEASNLCLSEPPLLALTTPILLGETVNSTRAMIISLPKKLYESLQPFDLEVGTTRQSQSVLPPQNIDWLIKPVSKNEFSVILKYRPPTTNPGLLKTFTFVLGEKGAERERVVVSVSDGVSRQLGADGSVTPSEVLWSQADETILLNVTLKSRFSQGEAVQLSVFTNGDEDGAAVFTLKPPTFDPVQFWEAKVKSVQSNAISFTWTTPIFGSQNLSEVIIKAKPTDRKLPERTTHKTGYYGDVDGLQPWTNYSITLTAVYIHGSYKKEIGTYRTAVDAVDRTEGRSHIAVHCLENEHQFDFDGAQVIGRVDSKLAREVIEAWKTHSNSINGILELPKPYAAARLHMRTRRVPIRRGDGGPTSS
ncbi:unnamed protein product [Dibothriocephalus latus]|uniref:Fibronectin type-III domain-containing protein n=1 Tax=Dibothriocephalus latus TaxID=60516 RepID=A0A3P7M3Q8_DIBLA|nr:unnamed protein product [Dibothriocephalus latus]